MLWRHFRRAVTHGECFPTKQALLAAARVFFTRHNRQPQTILSVIGAKATNPICLYLVEVLFDDIRKLRVSEKLDPLYYGA